MTHSKTITLLWIVSSTYIHLIFFDIRGLTLIQYDVTNWATDNYHNIFPYDNLTKVIELAYYCHLFCPNVPIRYSYIWNSTPKLLIQMITQWN